MLLRYTLPIILTLVVSCAGSPVGNNNDVSDPKVKVERSAINISGMEKKNGLFDVSLEYGQDGIGWIAFSRVQIPKFIDTHIAKSLNNGRTWTYVTAVGKSEVGTLNINSEIKEGVWRDETPSLLYDPTDIQARRWKLYTNHYFVAKPFKPKSRLMSLGSINVRYAENPAGPWSKPQCVIGNTEQCNLKTNNAHRDLEDVKFNTEPGAIVEDGTIYLAMDAGTTQTGLGDWENYRVILLASDDHGETWRYVGTLLDHDDAKAFGYRVFTGISLVRSKGKIYAFASPSGAIYKKNKGHDGTMVIEVSDISHAEIRRDNANKPIMTMRLEPKGGSGGLADYDEQNTEGGIVFSEINLFKFPRVFRLYQTDRNLEHH